MIEFEASGEFDSVDDIIYSLEELIRDLRGGCNSGCDGNLNWDVTEEEEPDGMCGCGAGDEPHYHCEGCGCILDFNDDLDPNEKLCNPCYKALEEDEL